MAPISAPNSSTLFTSVFMSIVSVLMDTSFSSFSLLLHFSGYLAWFRGDENPTGASHPASAAHPMKEISVRPFVIFSVCLRHPHFLAKEAQSSGSYVAPYSLKNTNSIKHLGSQLSQVYWETERIRPWFHRGGGATRRDYCPRRADYLEISVYICEEIIRLCFPSGNSHWSSEPTVPRLSKACERILFSFV